MHAVLVIVFKYKAENSICICICIFVLALVFKYFRVVFDPSLNYVHKHIKLFNIITIINNALLFYQ